MKPLVTVVVGFLLIVLRVPLYAQTKRIVAGYRAISATQTGFYLAKEARKGG